MEFPDDFLWGVSTSAFQIEGATAEDGRGTSVWDTFCATPGRVHDGDTADVACDHYHRHPEDIALMADLGVRAYRFSTAWPRVQPTGSGPANPAGLAFYDRLVDQLCAAGIQPVLTLYHWDTPQPLEDAGGWLNRDTAHRFAEYAALVGDRLADRVSHWIPINEPAMVTLLGYAIGQHAPGQALLFDALPTAHHLNLAHGLAVTARRAAGARAVGTANNHTPVWPATDTAADHAAAQSYSALHNWIYADPQLTGRYPDPLGERMPIRDGDLAAIAAPLDFYGVNYYNPTRLRAPSEGNPLPFDLVDIDEHPKTGFGWPVVPDGLRQILVELRDRYQDALPPILVTENGASYPDEPGPDGAVHDPDRVTYLAGHLDALAAARAQGVPVRGYFVWSIIDNFEWDAGYSQRFGLVHVDYPTQRRTPKDSYHWYRRLVRGE